VSLQKLLTSPLHSGYSHLKPGGWVEFQCMSGVLQCDDGTVPPDSALQGFSDHLRLASAAFQTPVDDPSRWKGWMEARGFETVTEEVFSVPCSPWPRDPRLRLVGAYQQENLVSNLEGVTTRLFTRALNWTTEQVNVFHVGVRKDMKNTGFHGYWPL
jgi:hypothetical protein